MIHKADDEFWELLRAGKIKIDPSEWRGWASVPEPSTTDLREELRPILEDPPIRVRSLAEITEVWNKAQGPLTVRIPAEWIDWEGVKGIASVQDPEDPRPPR